MRQFNIAAAVVVTAMLSLLVVAEPCVAVNLAKKTKVFSNLKDAFYLDDGDFTSDSYAYTPKELGYNPFIRLYTPNRIKSNRFTIFWSKKYTPKYLILKYGDVPYIMKPVYKKYKLKFKQTKYKGVVSSTVSYNEIEGAYLWIEFPKAKNLRITELMLGDSNSSDTKQENLTYQVNDVRAVEIGDTSAIIEWNSEVDAAQKIYYGEDTSSLFSSNRNIGVGKKHRDVIDHLWPGTTYYYTVGMMGSKSGVVFSDFHTLFTSGLTLPRFKQIIAKSQKYSANINFATNIPVKPYIDFFNKTGFLLKHYPVSSGFSTAFDFNVRGLVPGTEYSYVIYLIDRNEQVRKSSVRSLSTRENDIALGKTATGTFQPAEYLTDGDNSALYSMARSGSLKKENYFIIDLGAQISLDKIVIQWRALAYPFQAEIFVGNDTASMQFISKAQASDTSPIVRSWRGDPMINMEAGLKGVNARYIKAVIRKNTPAHRKHKTWDYLELLEVKVFKVENSDSAAIIK